MCGFGRHTAKQVFPFFLPNPLGKLKGLNKDFAYVSGARYRCRRVQVLFLKKKF